MKEYVRTIIDYPVKGIKFRDITTLLQNSKHFEKVINVVARLKEFDILDKVGFMTENLN